MKLTKEIRRTLTVGTEKFTSVFRRPTNEELNEFLDARFSINATTDAGKKERRQVRADFYDSILIGIEDLEIDGVPVTPETKNLIPEAWKGIVVSNTFEVLEVSEKN